MKASLHGAAFTAIVIAFGCSDPATPIPPLKLDVEAPATVDAQLVPWNGKMYFNCDYWVQLSVSGGDEGARVKLVSLESRFDYQNGERWVAGMTDRIVEFFGSDELSTAEVRRSPNLNSGPDWHPWQVTHVLTWKQIGTATTVTDSAATRCE